MKKGDVSCDDDKKETETPPPPTTIQPQQKDEEEEECSICLDVLPKDPSKFSRATCCGKAMHKKCRKDMITSKMSQDQKSRCAMCRTEYPDDTKEGRKEEIKRLHKWVKKGKAWAQLMLGGWYSNGTHGVKKDETRAVVLFNLAAEQGNAGAQYNLGCLYNNGRGVDKDEKRAVELYTVAADQGYVIAQYNLGVMYERGRGVDKDDKRAVKWYTLAADQGYVSAQYNLGNMYSDGRGVDKDEKRAVKMYTLAADQGDAVAQYNLGNMYSDGRGVDKDEKRAVELYTLAADQGFADAQYNLGCLYANGKSVDQSLTKAREWFTKAAAQGHKEAINALKQVNIDLKRTTTPSSTSSTVNSNTTFCSYCNKPEPTNTKFNRCKRCRSVYYCNRECQMKHWIDKPNGHKKQCKQLKALLKLKKEENKKKKELTTDDADKKETAPPPPTTTTQSQEEQKGEGEEGEVCSICLDLLPKSATKFMRATCCGKGMHTKCREDMIASKMSQDQKDRCVMCRTKYSHDTKDGIKREIKRVRKWMKKGKAWAQTMLGGWYSNGTHGVKKDEKRAVVLYNLASEQGFAQAQYNLGVMYNNGRGVDRDDERAVKLYTLAADRGHVGAQYKLGCMYHQGQGVDKDEKRAVELYTLAADQGHASAQYNLGAKYGNGKGVDQSFAKAREWFTKAASQGHEDATNALKKINEFDGRTTTPSSTVNSNTIFCSYCNKPEPTNTKFNKCKGCRSVAYCNQECQVKHWKTKPNGHKKQCKKLAAANKTLNKKNGK